MNALTNLNYNGHELRTVTKENEMWWVLADVCEILGLSNPTVVASRLDEDERAKFNLGRQGYGTIINESGLYAVILRSDKPEAKPFRKWVTAEVLPSIRKTGKYEAPVERPKKALQVLNLKGMKVVSNAEIARYMRVSNAVVRHHATMLGEYGILLGGREIARLKRDNPSLSPFLSILVVYSLGVAERIIDRMNAITRPLPTKVPTRVPTKPMPYVKPEPKMVHDGIDEALAAFNYLVKNRPNTGNDDINKAFATVLMGIYVDISGKMKS